MSLQASGGISQAEKTIESIRSSAGDLLKTFRKKLEKLRGNEEITKFFIRQGFDRGRCFEEAMRFLGPDPRYLAIDGTKFEDDRIDMIVFYAGAFGYLGDIHFSNNREILADTPKTSKDSCSLSSAIPVSQEYASIVNSEHTEGGEIDPQRVSSALMSLSEYFLAFTSVIQDPKIKVVLLDRTVSGDIAHISWKMREYILFGRSILEGHATAFGRVTKADLELGRMLIGNPELGTPSPRSHLLKYAVMRKLLEEGPLTTDQLGSMFGTRRESLNEISKVLKRAGMLHGAFSIHRDRSGREVISVPDSMKHYWDRLLEASLFLSTNIFLSRKGHPLKVDPESERWITAEDIDYITLIMISALLNEAWKRNILVLGIVKDSAANELVRTVIPILETSGLLKISEEIPKFESDRMLLQANSIVNSSKLETPWRTFEYDVCFRTISPKKSSREKGECDVSGALKNVIAPERLFVKAYFQLWSSSNDPSLRSHVFLYDRPCYPTYESREKSPELTLLHLDKVEETIVPAIHFLEDSPISDLIMGILVSMGSEPIPEALGHNYPLFLADKRAKVAEAEARETCGAAVDLEISRSRLDQQMLYERRFRDYRSTIESDRRSKK